MGSPASWSEVPNPNRVDRSPGSSRRRRSVKSHRRVHVAALQCGLPSKPIQGRVIAPPLGQELFSLKQLTLIDRQTDPLSPSVKVRVGERLEDGVSLIEPVHTSQTVGQDQPRSSITGVGRHALSERLAIGLGIPTDVPRLGPVDQAVQVKRVEIRERRHLSIEFRPALLKVVNIGKFLMNLRHLWNASASGEEVAFADAEPTELDLDPAGQETSERAQVMIFGDMDQFRQGVVATAPRPEDLARAMRSMVVGARVRASRRSAASACSRRPA